MGLARRPLLLALTLLAACSATSAAPEASAPTTTPRAGPRLTAAQDAALTHLADLSGPVEPAAATAHDHPVTFASALSPADQATFHAQLAAAREAATHFRTTEDATAA